MNTTNQEVESQQKPQCPCGHTKTHPMVNAHGQYTGIGWFLHLVGISYQPVKVRYQCLKCSVYFDETTDPNILKNFN